MIVDTSVLITILRDEPEAELLPARLTPHSQGFPDQFRQDCPPQARSAKQCK
jgi:hypothetical protein